MYHTEALFYGPSSAFPPPAPPGVEALDPAFELAPLPLPGVGLGGKEGWAIIPGVPFPPPGFSPLSLILAGGEAWMVLLGLGAAGACA